MANPHPNRNRNPNPNLNPNQAAAFTAEDSLQQFVAAQPPRESSAEELIAARLSGAELFGRLAEADLEGVVFNPAGPGSPMPLMKAVAAHILTGE